MIRPTDSDAAPLVGNDRFEGYIVDMLERLARKAEFSYVIQLVADNKFGRRLESGRWNGMIREVMESVSNRIIRKFHDDYKNIWQSYISTFYIIFLQYLLVRRHC